MDAPRVDPAHDRRFFSSMALAALMVVFAGFATSYYLWPLTRATHYPAGQPISPSVPLIVHAHAALFSAWVVLFVVQSWLVAAGRTAVHRRLGPVALGLLPAMVITGVATAIAGGRDGWNPGGPFRDSLQFMLVGVFDIAVFASLAGAGLYFRRRPGLHKRLMLLGTLGGLMWPAITRMPVIAGRFGPMFALLTVLVLATAVRDIKTGSPFKWVSISAGGAILVTFPLRAAMADTTAWHAIATWLVT